MTTYEQLKPHVEQDLSRAREARARLDHDTAWRALERAHVLSQPSVRLHTRVHLRMLLDALRDLDLREIVGQIARILVAPIGSALGRYPQGNTGRARVSMFQPMSIPEDLAAILPARQSPPPSAAV